MISTQLLFTENSDTEKQIYCDMDGVLTDFIEQAQSVDSNIFNLEPDKMWKKIADSGVSFWGDMPWTKDGKVLWEYIKKFNPKILTALPGLSKNDPNEINANKGKKIWVEQNLGEHVLDNLILTTSEEKKKYSSSNKILIDDREKLISQWIQKGGDGIVYKNAMDTISQLKDIM